MCLAHARRPQGRLRAVEEGDGAARARRTLSAQLLLLPILVCVYVCVLNLA